MCGTTIISFEWLEAKYWDLVHYSFIYLLVADEFFFSDKGPFRRMQLKVFVESYDKWHIIFKTFFVRVSSHKFGVKRTTLAKMAIVQKL